MNLGHLVMATGGENIKGFLALLNEVMWRANYTYRLEYAVYAKGVGHGMVDYMAKVHILSHLDDPDEEVECDVWGKGISMELVVQVVAYYAIAMLREELYMLSKLPF